MCICKLLMQKLKSAGRIRWPHVLLVAATESTEGLPSAIRRCFSHELNLDPLTEEERAKMITKSLQNITEISADVCLILIAFLSVLQKIYGSINSLKVSSLSYLFCHKQCR